jgi:hypothetical protein
MKKVLILLMIGIIVSCSNDAKYIEIVKQKVKDDALGIDMNYKNISFQWMDTLTVGRKLKTGLDLYDEMLNKLLSSSYFSNESLNKEKLIELRNWENERRSKDRGSESFSFDGKKYENYEEFAFANRNASQFISDFCDQIEKTDKILMEWDNLEMPNLDLFKNVVWYYERQDSYYNIDSPNWKRFMDLINELENLKAENTNLSEMNSDEVLEYKALNKYKINNPILNGAEQEVSKFFVFDKDFNVIRTELQ